MQRAIKRRAEGEPESSAIILDFGSVRISDPGAVAVMRLVAARLGVPAILLMHPSRCVAEIAEARQLAMYLMHVVFNRDYANTGRIFGRDRTTVAHACAAMEDKRDSARFDEMVSAMEAELAPHAEAANG